MGQAGGSPSCAVRHAVPGVVLVGFGASLLAVAHGRVTRWRVCPSTRTVIASSLGGVLASSWTQWCHLIGMGHHGVQ